jgi:outer membrane immunogenic protein
MLELGGRKNRFSPEGSMNRTKLAMLAGTSLCLSFGAAYAADMPVKARVAPVAITDPWVGFYAGGNIGYSFGRTHDAAFVSPFSEINPREFGTFEFPGGTSATSSKVNGVIGGGQAGFVGRIAPHWLAAVEADLQWSGQKGTAHAAFAGSIPDQQCTSAECSFTNSTDITKKLTWFGTLRFKTGYEVNDIWIYGTAGLAYGEVSVSGNNTLLAFADFFRPPPVLVGTLSTPFRFSQFQVGYSAGLGAEGLIRGTHWRWKAEWLHLDLGSTDGGLFSSVLVRGTRFTDEIVRIGFNYSFNGDSPIVAKY